MALSAAQPLLRTTNDKACEYFSNIERLEYFKMEILWRLVRHSVRHYNTTSYMHARNGGIARQDTNIVEYFGSSDDDA